MIKLLTKLLSTFCNGQIYAVRQAKRHLPHLQSLVIAKPYYYILSTLLLVFLVNQTIFAEGTQDAAPTSSDAVMLFTNNPTFGDFASPGTDSTSRLYVTFCDPDEKLYIKLSREFDALGIPQLTGEYDFQIRSSDGTLVHGPFTINNANENASTWAEATFTGIADAAYSGFYTFTPPAAGDYYIEFVDDDQAVIGFWDFTVADAVGDPKPGRLWSQNWALRTPQINDALPECEWDRAFNATIYSYTSDGFVSKIDFEDSGFQGLSFNINFTSMGPGDSGDPIMDRKSMVGNTTVNAEHKIFFNPPDPCAFPDGECGTVDFEDQFSCNTDGDLCLPVTVTQPGQVEVLLDFDNNQVFDPNSEDVLLIHCFMPGDELTTCVPWDGLKGDGSMVGMGETPNVVVTYGQGVQHWAVFDGEFMKNGFCVEVVRPDCQGLNTNKLYWDDELIPELPGTGQPKQQLSGCECRVDGCRTWNYFDPMDDDCFSVNDANTVGYGDKNTLNTWWFAQLSISQPVSIPILSCDITGPAALCEGEDDVLKVTFPANLDITNIDWTGPGGFSSMGDATNTTVTVSIGGTYTVTITDVNGCTTTCTYELLTQICCPCTQPPVINCPDDVVFPCNPEDSNGDGIPDAIPDPAMEIADGAVTASSPDMGCMVTITHGGDATPVQSGCTYKMERTYIATNDCGDLSISCTQIFAWTVDEDPVITNPASNLEVPCDAVMGLNAWLANNGGATATDDCGMVTWSNDFAGLNTNCGSTTVTFTATDECGGTASTTANYIITDNQPPQGMCPPGITGLTNPGDAPDPDPAAVAANYTDNCGAVSVQLIDNFQSGAGCAGFSVHYIYEISDDCGNSTTCEVIHVGGSNLPLQGNCPQGQEGLQCFGEVPPADPDGVAALFTGAGPITVVVLDTIDTGDDCTGFSRTYVYHISDACDTRICEVTYSGQDFKPPYGTCPSGLTGLSCVEDIPDPDPDEIATHYWDNCGMMTVNLIQTIDNTQNCWYFSRTYVYEILDACGHQRICEVTHSGGTQPVSTSIEVATDLTCIDQVPEPDADAAAALFDNGCGDELTGFYWTTITFNRYCTGFRVSHFYMVMQECGGMFWVALHYEGTNCPGCEDDGANQDEAATAFAIEPELGSPADHTNITVYPNPSKGEFNVTLEGFNAETVELRLMDMNGTHLLRRKIDYQEGVPVLLDLEGLNLPSGVYYLSVNSGKQVKVEKVVLQR